MPAKPLEEPQADTERLALDRAVAEAVRLRITAGPRPSPDADTIALRDLLKDLPSAATADSGVPAASDHRARKVLSGWL